ncbi:MAG TPA: TadE/TadG family type IV pilus assembly protein [Methylotenera sp.]|nr:TadE/TadG family type IV pilus assembly protein [Methylotenera sp.]
MKMPFKSGVLYKMLGQSMVEYLIILPTLLLLVLGAIQFALLYQIKSQVNYATFAAARQGALKNGSTTAIKDAFGAGMTPIFTNKPDFSGMLRGRAVGAIEAFTPLVTKIERISPPDSAKNDSYAFTDAADNKKTIPNDNLQYRSTATGANSGLNVQDANILKIRVTYCAKLIVPVANVVFYSLVNGIKGTENVAGEFFSTPTSSAATPNSCSMLKDQYGAKIDSVNNVTSVAGVDLTFIKTALNSASNFLNNTPVPGLNWTIGGYRIPVTSEAVVRMQTPMKF